MASQQQQQQNELSENEASTIPVQLPHETTGYEPNNPQSTSLPQPPPQLMGNPEALLDWYLSQHAAASVPQPSNFSGVPGSTHNPTSLPLGIADSPLPPIGMNYGGTMAPQQQFGGPQLPMPMALGAPPMPQSLFPGIIMPQHQVGRFAFPQQQQFGFSGTPPQQQQMPHTSESSMLSSLSAMLGTMAHGTSNVAQTVAASTLNPMLKAMQPTPPLLQLVPPTPAYYTPTAEAQSLPPQPQMTAEVLQQFLASSMQPPVMSQPPQVPVAPQAPASLAGSQLPAAPDDSFDAQTSIPIGVVMKLLEMVKSGGGGSQLQSQLPGNFTVREADRIMITPLPTHMEYSQWRFGLTANLMSACPHPHLIEKFINEISDPNVSDAALVANRPPQLASIDAKLFAGLVQTLIAKPSDDTTRILSNIRTLCTSGCGRQALRVIDGDYMHQGPKRRQVALELLHRMSPVNELAQVEPTIVKLKGILMELRGSSEMPSEAFLLGMLRTLFGNVSKLAPVFTTYDLLPNMAPQHLMDTLMRTCSEFRASQSIKNKAPSKAIASAATGGGKGDSKGKAGKGDKGKDGEKCKLCSKKGHKASECWSTKTCTGCQKKGHPWEHCFTNPKSKSYKPPKLASAATQPQQVALPPGLDASAILASLSASSSSVGPAIANAAQAAPSPLHDLNAQQVAEFQRYLAAQAMIKKAYGMRAALPHKIGNDDSSKVLLDSGATFHFTGQIGKDGIQAAPPVEVTTAGGIGTFDNGETQIENGQVGSLNAKFAPGALPAAGLGKLIRELKLDFRWSWRDFHNPILVDDDGEAFNINVESDCPFLAASATKRKDAPIVPSVSLESEEGMNVEPCAFGSHNFVCDTSHVDELHNLNEQFSYL